MYDDDLIKLFSFLLSTKKTALINFSVILETFLIEINFFYCHFNRFWKDFRKLMKKK